MAHKTIRELTNISNTSSNAADWGGAALLASAEDLSTYNVTMDQISNYITATTPTVRSGAKPTTTASDQTVTHSYTTLLSDQSTSLELEYGVLYNDPFYGWCEVWHGTSFLGSTAQWKIIALALWDIENKIWVRGTTKYYRQGVYVTSKPLGPNTADQGGGSVPSVNKNGLAAISFSEYYQIALAAKAVTGTAETRL